MKLRTGMKMKDSAEMDVAVTAMATAMGAAAMATAGAAATATRAAMATAARAATATAGVAATATADVGAMATTTVAAMDGGATAGVAATAADAGATSGSRPRPTARTPLQVGKEQVDLRFVEQLVHGEQTAALAQMVRYCLEKQLFPATA